MITVRNKDALWMTPEIKKMILDKAKIYRRYVKKGRNACDYELLQDIILRCKTKINEAKFLYYNNLSSSLTSPNIGPKKYWSILHQFLNKRKIPNIPPIDHNNSIITDTSQKANIFNTFFAKQCSLLQTDSVIPELRLLTNHQLDTIDLDSKKILAIIRSVDVNKAHGWDDVSARMIKICDDSLVKPVLNIFRCSFDSGKYPNNWKRGNLTPVHKKGDKNVIKNYRPVSLLPIMGKMFEKCIYDTLYSYFEKHNLFPPCQSGFRKNDSCISLSCYRLLMKFLKALMLILRLTLE